jgi:hypothetical protein
MLLGIVRLWCDPTGEAIKQWGVLAILTIAGTAMGPLISALAKTEEVAVALVPIAVIPQIILAGVIAPLSGAAKVLERMLISTSWGSRALDSLLPDDALFLVHPMRFGYWSQIAIIGVHATAFSGLTLFVLWWQGRAKRK